MPSKKPSPPRSKRKRSRRVKQPLISQDDIADRVIYLLKEADRVIGDDLEMAEIRVTSKKDTNAYKNKISFSMD